MGRPRRTLAGEVRELALLTSDILRELTASYPGEAAAIRAGLEGHRSDLVAWYERLDRLIARQRAGKKAEPEYFQPRTKRTECIRRAPSGVEVEG